MYLTNLFFSSSNLYTVYYEYVIWKKYGGNHDMKKSGHGRSSIKSGRNYSRKLGLKKTGYEKKLEKQDTEPNEFCWVT